MMMMQRMKETIYTQTLARAAQAEGGTAALASLLHVPEKTLERWMSGRAQTPLRAFFKALERLATHEARGVAAPLPRATGEPLGFRLGAANGAGLGRPAGDVARSQRARRAPGERTPAICRFLRAGERSLRRHRRPWHHRTGERRGGRHTASPQARTARQAVDHLHRA